MLHLKEYLSHVKPGIALDVGTRFGEFAFTLVEAMPEGSRVIGIDCDAATVEQAREKSAGKGVEVQVPDYVAEVLENAQMMADTARRYVDRMAN